MTDYKASLKIDGKWKTIGSVKNNKFGNLSLTLFNGQELKDLVKTDNKYLNIALFEEKPKTEYAVAAGGNQVDDLNDSVPF